MQPIYRAYDFGADYTNGSDQVTDLSENLVQSALRLHVHHHPADNPNHTKYPKRRAHLFHPSQYLVRQLLQRHQTSSRSLGTTRYVLGDRTTRAVSLLATLQNCTWRNGVAPWLIEVGRILRIRSVVAASRQACVEATAWRHDLATCTSTIPTVVRGGYLRLRFLIAGVAIPHELLMRCPVVAHVAYVRGWHATACGYDEQQRPDFPAR